MDRTHLEGEPNTKVVKGTVTSCGNDYGWIEDCVFFRKDAVIGTMPLHVGDKVLAFVEEDPISHELKATEVCISSEQKDVPKEAVSKIKDLTVCVSHVKKNIIYIADEYHFCLDSISKGSCLDFIPNACWILLLQVIVDSAHLPDKAILGFMPYEGDWLDIEYSVEQGSSKITVHSLKATQRRRLEEVCVTNVHRREGMLNHTIFFTLDSLRLPLGYTPVVGHMVSVVIVQSIRPNYNWRAITMTPVAQPVEGPRPGKTSSLFLYQ
ncbi:hypothetical protein APTSU1_001801900 [Apodemus speciosus]|uniref:S1-like RNA binding domain-containing protein n=1 Tax=Apodemus speciosus TaxID=105296 RepID=A0ABQ0FU87_APOSI